MKFARRSGKASVYLIRCQDHLKIGVAGYVERRLMLLQVGNPFELELVAYRRFDNAALADAAEALLHREFAAHRIRGEWFEITDEAAIEALRAISAEEMSKPKMVTIEWFPHKGAPAFTEEVPESWVEA